MTRTPAPEPSVGPTEPAVAVLPVGDRAWLLEARDADDARGLARALRESGVPGVLSVRTGARTVLVELSDPQQAALARDRLCALRPRTAGLEAGADVTLEVVYVGAELAEGAAELGVSVEARVAEHTTTAWTADFCGFAPGFAYLSGWRRVVRRRAEPRTRVPSGAVGLADGFSAVYPSASPGGWRLVGHAVARLWDTERDQPALVGPGDRVRFRAVREHVTVPSARAEASSSAPDHGLLVVDPGPLTLVQDRGRPGHEHLGVPPSGAADATAAGQANRLVGNTRDAAVLECLGGLEVEAVGDQVVAVVGAHAVLEPAPAEGHAGPSGSGSADGGGAPEGQPAQPADEHRAIALPDGARLRVAVPTPAARCYLAVRGGLQVPPVLGSRSTDALSGLGPAPVAAGALLPVAPGTGVVGPPEPAARPDPGALRVVLGPRSAWFTDEAVRLLLDTRWTVSAEANRVGLRLDGPALRRSVDAELASEPMVAGAIQVPPSGRPVVLLRDHPVTGGYPVIGVVLRADLDRLGRLASGDTVRFTVED